MTYLVDANVLSEPTRPAPDPRIVAWLGQNEAALVIDPVILGELRFGILLLPAGKSRARLEQWFEAGAKRLRCIDWEAATGLRWARLLADLRSTGRAQGQPDRRHRPHARPHPRHSQPARLRRRRSRGRRPLRLTPYS